MQDFKEILSQRLNEKFPDFENKWNQIVREIGNDFVSLMRERISDEFKLFKEISNFKLSIVIDNNFLFGQIKGLIKQNKKLEDSFIYKICSSELVEVFAPFKLKEEIYKKITQVIPDKEIATKYADQLLTQITIKDAEWVQEWKKANNLIGHIDDDDVPYLALAFHIGSHSIVSYDRVFDNQGDAQVWNLQEMDKVITNYNKGFVSFFCMGSIPSIIKTVWKICVAFFKLVGEVFIGLIQVAGFLVIGTIEALSKIPWWVYLSLITAGAAGLIFSDAFREGVKNKGEEYLGKAGDFIGNFITSLGELLSKLDELIWILIEGLIPVGIIAADILGFLILEYKLMTEQVEKLEAERAK